MSQRNKFAYLSGRTGSNRALVRPNGLKLGFSNLEALNLFMCALIGAALARALELFRQRAEILT